MKELKKEDIISSYRLAKAYYSRWSIDTDQVLEALKKIPISMHCWQGDDVSGFESPDVALTGGIQVTGSYPGKARTPEQLRQDIEKAFSLIPGKHRLNLHAIYGESNGEAVSRDKIGPEHFVSWVEWAKSLGVGLDFNPSCFSHPLSKDGFTLTHQDETVRQFWIDHCKASRKIGEYFGKELGTPCVTNLWIPDGYKDIPVDRLGPRIRLKESLDEIYKEEIDEKYNLDAVESKVFGIGSESYTVGSHEFYMGYAIENKKLLCLDVGHFHPTEVISNKISGVLPFVDQLLLHVSRPVRWDSDHVVILDEELITIAQEIIRGDFLDRVHIGLDFFDATINRVAAWIIGTRNMIKALLIAMLEPSEKLKKYERSGDYTSRLAMLEELKSFPWGAVWNYYCLEQGVPSGEQWLQDVKEYESEITLKRA